MGLALALGTGFSTPVAAQEFPSHPLTMIVPWGAGGGSDRTARIIALALEDELGQSINVVNRTGGGGAVGHVAGANARADGYTLVFGTIELGTYKALDLANVSGADFEPIGLVNWDPFAISVNAGSPFQTLAELQAAIAERPGEITVSGAGYGGSNHVAVLGWLSRAGLDVNAATFIPAPSGSAGAIQELVAGGIDVVITTLPEFAPMIDAGKVRALALMSDERDANFPDVPTLEEAVGIKWTFGPWRGLLVPKGVSEDRLVTLREALARAVENKDFVKAMGLQGFNVYYMDATDFGNRMADEEQVFSELLGALQ